MKSSAEDGAHGETKTIERSGRARERGARGIGAGIVRGLASEGAAVAFTYAASEAKALQLVREVETGGGRAIALKADSAVEIVVPRPPEAEGVSGYGVAMTLTFQAKRVGRFSVKITKGAVIQSNQQSTAASGSENSLSVQ